MHLVGQDRDLNARYILVATGGRLFVPSIPGAELAITSNQAFDLPALPDSILIEDDGYIAVEFATIFADLGVHTTIIYRGDCLLRSFDDDMRQGLEVGLIDRGIKIIYQTTIASLARDVADIATIFSGGVTAPYGAVMFATGRFANIEGLGLERAGVELQPNGTITVDAFSQTSVPSIYAVGDVTGRAALTPVAIRDG